MRLDRRAGWGLACAAAAYAGWGLLAPVGKVLLEDMGPLTLNAVRMALGAAVLAPFLSPDALRTALSYLRRPEVVVLALVGGAVDLSLYFYALTMIDPVLVALGFYTAPLWTALLAWLVLREQMGWAFLPAAAGLVAGGALALGIWPGGALEARPLGLVLAVATGVGWAVYAVGLRRFAPGLRLRPLVLASFLVWTAYFWIAALAVEGVPRLAGTGLPAWGWMALYVAVPTVACYGLFAAALQRAPAGAVNLLVGLEVVFTVVFSAWILGLTPGPMRLAGIALVLASVTGYMWHRSRLPRLPVTPG